MFEIVLVRKSREEKTGTGKFVKAVSAAYAKQVGEYVLAEEAARTTPLTKAQARIEQAEAFVRTEAQKNRLAKACRDANAVLDWNQKPVKEEKTCKYPIPPKKWGDVVAEKFGKTTTQTVEFEPFEV